VAGTNVRSSEWKWDVRQIRQGKRAPQMPSSVEPTIPETNEENEAV
jgi:hypothetical protein